MTKFRLTVYIASSKGTNKQVKFTAIYVFKWMAVIAAWWDLLGIESLLESGTVTSEILIERIDGKQQGTGSKQVGTEQI